ncbi:MAG: PIN domain-containing protein [Alphaproteobacteria bacterium]|nr:PIN domain-containing protein [Alphaproteobacteria bacterium]
MIVLDANIAISTIAGIYAQAQLGRLVAAGVETVIPAPQLAEAYVVLTAKLGAAPDDTMAALNRLQTDIRVLEPADYGAAESAARMRLRKRGQSDWPVLAAALAYGAEIWSNDRDFFGVGVPVWSTRNIHLAGAAAPV